MESIPNVQPHEGPEPGNSYRRVVILVFIGVGKLAWDVYSFFFRGAGNGQRAAASL